MLPMRQHDDHLLQIPLFSGFSRKDLQHVHQISTEIQLPAGQELMQEGSIGHEMVVVLEGNLEVTCRGEHVADIGPGGFAGELALLSHRRRNSTVTATVPTTVLHIDGRGFMALLEDVPQLAVKMLPIVAARLAPVDD
jgi:CRP/FNR family transcriptional regulator, cyclic AMP receptor protein